MKWTFIEPEPSNLSEKERYPASYVRKQFQVKSSLSAAEISMTALGVYHIYVNGKKINENEWLLPGFTDYNKRLQYQVFDLKDVLTVGENVIVCILGDGWYRGCVGSFSKFCAFGTQLKLACNISLRYSDGTEESVSTDESWLATQCGPLRENDLKMVEVYDARLEQPDWYQSQDEEALLKTDWHKCRRSSYSGDVVKNTCASVHENEVFTPELIHTPNGEYVLDFKQNHQGHIAFEVCGKSGDVVELVMGETLDEEGNFTLKNLEGEGRSAKVMPLGQRVQYTLREGHQTYKMQFMIAGYRYVLLKNWPETPVENNFRSYAMYTPMREIGSFQCSNPLLNQLLENIKWSMKSNFAEIPTDCPHRERAGWAGDANVFSGMADYLVDTRQFFRKWLLDIIDSQDQDGNIPSVIPKIPMPGGGASSAGWADVITVLPLQQYWYFGETQDIELIYEAAKKYVDMNCGRAEHRRWNHLFKSKPHYRYILDKGFHYGEWLEPGTNNLTEGLKAYLSPDEEVATAWFYYSAKNLAEMAGILGKLKDQEKYSDLAAKIRAAYQKEFLPEGKADSRRQCKYVRPLSMGLVEADKTETMARELNELCIQNDYHVNTGFLTTYRILQVLSDNGYTDTAYRIVENEDYPGWLYEVKQGATTVWEGWDAIDKTGKVNALSQNHYAPGAALSWLFSHCCGIKAAVPGFSSVIIKPMPGGSLTWAKASYITPHGKISVSWEKTGCEFKLEIQLPDGIEAKVILPDGRVITNAESGVYKCTLK